MILKNIMANGAKPYLVIVSNRCSDKDSFAESCLGQVRRDTSRMKSAGGHFNGNKSG